LSAKLKAYLARIGFAGTPAVDEATLCYVHRLHCERIPYENLDVQLGRPVTLSPDAAFAKIVEAGRGGWCFEMNALLGWALEEIGFHVTRHAGGVMGDENLGDHLVLVAHLDQPYVADAGFGDGLIEAAKLAEGAFEQDGLGFAFDDLGQGWWRFHNHKHGAAKLFDFHLEPASEAMLEKQSRRLQSDPASSFVLNAVCQIYRNGDHFTLRGRVLSQLHNGEVRKSILSDAKEYLRTLKDVFGLDLPEAHSLWPRIEARHKALFG
jgi:N-hydroxyarylamine O-acetyltransferase